MKPHRLDAASYWVRNRLRDKGFEVLRVAPRPMAENLLALHLHKLFEERRVDLVLDVGARVGDYGVWLRRNGYDGDIISFEPVSESFEQLAGKAGADPRWRAVNVALGSEAGDAEINVTHQTYFSSFLQPNAYATDEFEAGAEVDHVEKVTVRRLDESLPELVPNWDRRRVYLKMDTQGWDLEVLRGASGVLGAVTALQSEVSVQHIYAGMPDFDESLRELGRHGFELSGLFPVTLDTELRVVEFDCVCVASSRPAA